MNYTHFWKHLTKSFSMCESNVTLLKIKDILITYILYVKVSLTAVSPTNLENFKQNFSSYAFNGSKYSPNGYLKIEVI